MAMRIQGWITSSSSSSHIIFCCSTTLTPLLFSSSSSRRQKLSSSSNITFRRPFSSKSLSKPSSISIALQARRGFSSQERHQQDFIPSEDFCFQSPLKIVEYPDPLFRANNKHINTLDDNLKKLVHEMFDVMYKMLMEVFSLIRKSQSCLF